MLIAEPLQIAIDGAARLIDKKLQTGGQWLASWANETKEAFERLAFPNANRVTFEFVDKDNPGHHPQQKSYNFSAS